MIPGHLVRGQVSTGRLQGGARAARLHPLVGIISVGSFSLVHVVSAPFNLTHVRERERACVNARYCGPHRRWPLSKLPEIKTQITE